MVDIWKTIDDDTSPSVTLYLTIIEVGRLNSAMPLSKQVVLPDGTEIVVNIKLDPDKDKFSEELSNLG